MKLRLCACGAVLALRDKECAQCGRGKKRGRQGTTQAGYGWDWQQLRERFIKDNPLCTECAKNDKAIAAEEVHHIVPITEAPWLRLQSSNLMALCVTCHRSIELARQRAGGR